MDRKKVAELKMHEGWLELAREIEKREEVLKQKILNPDLAVRKEANKVTLTENDVYVSVISFLENIRSAPEAADSRVKYDIKDKNWKSTQVSDG